MTIPESIDSDGVSKAMQLIRDFLQGAKVMPMARESELGEAADKLIKEGKELIEKDEGDQKGWALINYGRAVRRNLNYASAGRGQLLALGANNSFREIYELGRLASDAGV